MKKKSKIYGSWILVGCFLPGLLSALTTEVQPLAPIHEEKALKAVEQIKQLSPEKKKNLKELIQELASYARKKWRSKPIRTLKDIEDHYKSDVRAFMVKAAITSILIGVGISVAAYAGGARLEKEAVGPFGEDEAFWLKFLATVSGPTIGLWGSLVSIPLALDDKAIGVKYRTILRDKFFIPQEKEWGALFLKIRKQRDKGIDKNVDVLVRNANKLRLDIDKTVQVSKKLFRLYDFHKESEGVRIQLVLEEFAKSDQISSTHRWLLGLALRKDTNGIEKYLKDGELHLFDEPWVWPAIATLINFTNTTKSTKQLVDLTKELLHWDKWRNYWAKIEQYAHQFKFIGQDTTIKSLTVPERQRLAARVTDKISANVLGN